MYDYINQTFGGAPQITIKDTPDGNRVMAFAKPKWAVEESPFTKHNKILPDPINTDYSIKREVPEQYDAMNGAGSPSYGGTNPRIKGIQEFSNESLQNKEHIWDVFNDAAVAWGGKNPFALPTIAEMMADGKTKYVRNTMGVPSLYDNDDNGLVKTPLIIPKAPKFKHGKDLPRFNPGKDDKQVERGGVVYNVSPSAIGASELDVTMPNINVRSNIGARDAHNKKVA